MALEKTTDEVILRLPADFDTFGLQRILNYLKYKDLIKSSQATEKQVTQLSNTSKNRWWEENKNRFIK